MPLISTLAAWQSRTQSNACAQARMALTLGKLNFSCAVIGLTFINHACRQRTGTPKFRGSGTLNLGVPVVNFPRANAILAHAQALLWVRDWLHGISILMTNYSYAKIIGKTKKSGLC